MNNSRKHAATTSTLMNMPVGVDLIRFEKNLLQMGFFGAHDTRHTTLSTRRIEHSVNRNGQRIKVSAEFRGSHDLGLPSTSDRDKYIAFMRIAMDQRRKVGVLENPIKFTGYHLLKELGLSFSGENYEDINRWGQRMADTTITSEQVIYMAARKKYANKTVHVFRSFTRAGHSELDGARRAETYEVVLEDWLLENLNQSYVVPEDFNAYRKLKRPTAKGIFGYLHLWFHASQGRVIEKDYTELCMLLNIPSYKHLSKIKETMGRSLDDLVSIQYLSKWDIRPMMTKTGYKLVLLPGDEVLKVLSLSLRRQGQEAGMEESRWTEGQREALECLKDLGVSTSKAEELVRTHDPDGIVEKTEYVKALVYKDRKKLSNPAGFVIYMIELEVSIPEGFLSTQHHRKNQELATTDRLRHEYQIFVDQQVEREIAEKFPGALLDEKLKEVLSRRTPDEKEFDNMFPTQSNQIAKHLIGIELMDSLALPTFEEWRTTNAQLNLLHA